MHPVRSAAKKERLPFTSWRRPAHAAVELVEDQKAWLQAIQKMIDLIASAGQACASPAALWRAQSRTGLLA